MSVRQLERIFFTKAVIPSKCPSSLVFK
uniref:Uncharacterized protein n=1 Tax=Anguilla anguilla TaxID=7936 RepID=A0A0E9RR62_ANGAN